MINKDWCGLVKILEINITDKFKNILWENKNLYNIFHTTGEEYALKALFVGDVAIPTNYYFGLDSRTNLNASDTLAFLTTFEMSGSGYARQPVASTGSFTSNLNGGINQVLSPVVSFSAVSGSFGPARTLFLATSPNSSGYLISSISLGRVVTLNDGESINLKMGLSMKDCP